MSPTRRNTPSPSPPPVPSHPMMNFHRRSALPGMNHFYQHTPFSVVPRVSRNAAPHAVPPPTDGLRSPRPRLVPPSRPLSPPSRMVYTYEYQPISVSPRAAQVTAPNAVLTRSNGPRSPRPRMAQPPLLGVGGVPPQPASLGPSPGGLPTPLVTIPRQPSTGFINNAAGPSFPVAPRLPEGHHRLSGFDFTPNPFAAATQLSAPPQPTIQQLSSAPSRPIPSSLPLVDCASPAPSPPLLPSVPVEASPQPSTMDKRDKGKGKEARRQYTPEGEDLPVPPPTGNDDDFYLDLEAGLLDAELVGGEGGGGGDVSMGDFMGDAIRSHSPLPNFLDRTSPPTPSPLPLPTRKRQQMEAVVINTRSKKARVAPPPQPPSTPANSRVLRPRSRAGPSSPAHRHGSASPPRGTPKKPLFDELLRALRKDGYKPYWQLDDRHACHRCRSRKIACLLPKDWTPGDKCLSCRSSSCNFCPKGARELVLVDNARQLHKGFKRSLLEYPEELVGFAKTFYSHLKKLVEPFATTEVIGIRSEYKMQSLKDSSEWVRMVPSLANRAPSSVAGSDYQTYLSDAGESSSEGGGEGVEGEEEAGVVVEGGDVNIVDTTDNVHSSSVVDNNPVDTSITQAGPEAVDIVMEGEDELDELDED